MNLYIDRLNQQLEHYHAICGQEEPYSITELLWRDYSETNPVDDGRIRECENAILPVFESLSVDASDSLSDLISNLCTAYQRAAFLEGIRVGVSLMTELK
ncbi:MAG: hypothetical protein IKM02_00500 [Clostridia bacterium]|nr:hypothetical protein [Clostridia bacterium]